MNPVRRRLDVALVNRGLLPSRARARDSILRGTVRIDGRVETRPSTAVTSTQVLTIEDDAAAYVSRAALKLKAALDVFGIDISGRPALDVGQSTGGFTQVLLGAGAKHVVGVDVGHGQLAPDLRDNTRVTTIEGVNARYLDQEPTRANAEIGGIPSYAQHQALHRNAPFGVIALDVSFISLRLVLPAALSFAAAQADVIALIKPQFEVGKSQIGKGGVVPSSTAHACAEDVLAWASTLPSWSAGGCPGVHALIASPIKGGDGNQEFLLHLRRVDDTRGND